jgi:hypothetical protein
MKRLLMIVLGAFLVSTPAFARDKDHKTASNKKINADGTVSAVSPNTLTIKAKGSQWTFAVAPSTRVTVHAANRKTAAARDSKQPLAITQYVRVGDLVSVRYRDMGGTRQATNVRVRSSLWPDK